MKKIAIMQPYFFPYIGYWQLISSVDQFIVYDDVNYIKGGWINRNRVLQNAAPHWLTLCLNGASSFKKINEINILDAVDSRKKLITLLQSCYQKAPHFSKIITLCEDIINDPEMNLARFLTNSFGKINKLLNIETEIILSSDIQKNNLLKGKDKILDICKILKADAYINPIGGTELYDKNNFSTEGIELCFIKNKPICYRQFSDTFVPGLSIIDILMFNNIDVIQNFLLEYELV